MNSADTVSAGAFSVWLRGLGQALRGEVDSDVPCGSCTACCTSAQFVHIGPDETDTLAHIPRELLFAAPRMPRGHVLMGYDEHGRCPMLVGGACSIYAHRPRTCRTYDCRVFPAAGVEPDDDKVLIAEQVKRWRFEHPTDVDRVEHDATHAAAAWVRDHAASLPPDARPQTANQLAVLAIEIHDAFIGTDASGRPVLVDPDPAVVQVAINRR